MKVGDKVKVLNNHLCQYMSNLVGKIATIEKIDRYSCISLKEDIYDYDWREEQLQLIGGSMIDDLQVGDLLIDERDEVKRVLAKLDGVVLLSTYVYEEDLNNDDIKKADDWYTDFELEETGWKKYTPGEIEEVTMDEVCKKFGKTVKIIKE